MGVTAWFNFDNKVSFRHVKDGIFLQRTLTIKKGCGEENRKSSVKQLKRDGLGHPGDSGTAVFNGAKCHRAVCRTDNGSRFYAPECKNGTFRKLIQLSVTAKDIVG